MFFKEGLNCNFQLELLQRENRERWGKVIIIIHLTQLCLIGK